MGSSLRSGRDCWWEERIMLKCPICILFSYCSNSICFCPILGFSSNVFFVSISIYDFFFTYYCKRAPSSYLYELKSYSYSLHIILGKNRSNNTSLIVFLQCRVGVCNTANFGIDPIPSKYRASIADTDSDTCHLKIHTFK